MTEPDVPHWERALLEKVALKAIEEQRRTRQWGALFKLLWFLLMFLLLAAWLGWIGRPDREADGIGSGRHTAVVSIEGVIAPDSKSSSEKVIKALNRAFKDRNTEGVVVRINSPGGSPVQSSQIHDEIRRLRAKYPEKPLYAVVEDVCASGGYFIAVAADKIYVDRTSIVGSIGAIISSFGFVGTMEKLGIERRAYTAGTNKDFLDPFAPERAEDREHAIKMLEEIHQQFIRVVKQDRGTRLKEVPEIFSGLVWTGERSIELGLADAFGSVDYVAREVVKAERVVDFSPEDNYLEQLSKRLGTSLGEGIAAALSRSGALSSVQLR